MVAAVLLASLFGCGGGGGTASGGGTAGNNISPGPGGGSNNTPAGGNPPVFNTRLMELVNKDRTVSPRISEQATRPLVQLEENGGLNPRISASGRYVAFESDNDNLVAGDTNGGRDLFVRDRTAQATSLIRVKNGVVTMLGPQIPLADLEWLQLQARSKHFEALQARVGSITEFFGVSPDGRYSLYATGSYRAHIYDLQTDTIIDFLPAANGGILGMSFAPDGSYIQFVGEATNLVPNDTNGVGDAFRYFIADGRVERISVHPDGTEFNDVTLPGQLSADGNWYMFVSYASNIVSGAAKGRGNVYLQNVQTGAIRLVTKGRNGPSSADTFFAAISGDGGRIVFSTKADNLIEGDTNGIQDTFLYDSVQDRILGRLSLTDRSRQATGGDGTQPGVSISADGNWVTFASDANKMLYNTTLLWRTNSYVTSAQVPQLFVPQTSHSNAFQLEFTGNANAILTPYTAPEVFRGEVSPSRDNLQAIQLTLHRLQAGMIRRMDLSLNIPEPGVPLNVGSVWELPFESSSVRLVYDEGNVSTAGGIWQVGNSGTITLVTLSANPGGGTRVGLRFDNVEMIANNSAAQGNFQINGTITVDVAP